MNDTFEAIRMNCTVKKKISCFNFLEKTRILIIKAGFIMQSHTRIRKLLLFQIEKIFFLSLIINSWEFTEIKNKKLSHKPGMNFRITYVENDICRCDPKQDSIDLQ